MNDMVHYGDLLRDIKSRIQIAQHSAILAVNSELICLYWDIGRIISQQQLTQGWGAAVIPRLAKDIQNELPEQKGFSERNIGRMVALFREYPDETLFLPQLVAKSPLAILITSIPWGHQSLLLEKVKDITVRTWYMEQTIANGWSRDTLGSMLKSNAHERQGTLAHNFDTSHYTIGLILCETKNKVFAEYALRDFAKPIGISAYELTRALPEGLKSSLPSIEELETELSKAD